MTRREKQKFVRDLIGSVQKTILAKIPQMPEEWDGIELRQLIADTFANQCHSRSMRAGLTKTGRERQANYKNECLVRNLT